MRCHGDMELNKIVGKELACMSVGMDQEGSINLCRPMHTCICCICMYINVYVNIYICTQMCIYT